MQCLAWLSWTQLTTKTLKEVMQCSESALCCLHALPTSCFELFFLTVSDHYRHSVCSLLSGGFPQAWKTTIIGKNNLGASAMSNNWRLSNITFWRRISKKLQLKKKNLTGSRHITITSLSGSYQVNILMFEWMNDICHKTHSGKNLSSGFIRYQSCIWSSGWWRIDWKARILERAIWYRNKMSSFVKSFCVYWKLHFKLSLHKWQGCLRINNFSCFGLTFICMKVTLSKSMPGYFKSTSIKINVYFSKRSY